MNNRETIVVIRNKDYYIKLLTNLRNNGLYDIISDEDLDYSQLVFKLLDFLNKNKKYIKNFQSKDFEKILILCIDEIMTEKFSIEVDYEKLDIVLNLLKNTYLFKTTFLTIKDFSLKLYYKYRCTFCLSQNDTDIIESENI
tara:strand:+ start:1721 stop:2143 length:423 start_codon:yes stop_codon:yes gene_type:complete